MGPFKLQTLLARQGIYDKSGAVYAYELLYRNNNDFCANVDNTDEQAGVQATASVVAHLFANLNIDTIIGNKLAFINFTHSDLVQQMPRLLPKDRIFIEVLETVEIDSHLISKLSELSKDGYKIALDDFVFKEEYLPLLAMVDVIKLDVLNQTKDDIANQMQRLSAYKGKFLAEKIDNKEQFKNCVELGFDYFQGFFLNKPDNIKGTVLTENKLQILGLLAEINKEDVSLQNLEEIILQIPKLSYRILRISNSAFYYAGHTINNLVDAIFRLGMVKIKDWTNLLLLASNDDAPSDLLERTLIRAKMCELLAKSTNYNNPHDAYMVGMFSTLDGMLNEPMPALLARIQLSDTFNQALLQHSGELGNFLKYSLDYEQANFGEMEHSVFDRNTLTGFYLQGIEYANSVLGILPDLAAKGIK